MMSIVYFYCNMETYKSMLNSKSLWLTNLTESNDSEEVTRLYENIWQYIRKSLLDSDIDKILINNFFENLEPTIEIQKETDIPFGCCFCIEPDLINLWNEYGENGKGVCLGFDLDWFPIKRQYPITSSILDKSIGYEKVIYDSPELRKRLTNICYSSIKEQGVIAWINSILPTFKHYASFIKNRTFKGEEEVRIVYYPYNDFDVSPATIGLSNLCENIKTHYCLSWCDNETIALKQIIVGPKCEYSEHEIGKMLSDSSIRTQEPVIISKSECSFRERK